MEKESTCKGFFPYKKNKKEYYEYEGKIPPIQYFCDTSTPPADKEAIVKFIENWPADKVWNFKTELHYYLKKDIEVLRAGATRLLEEFFNFQKQFNVRNSKLLHCFSPPYFTRVCQTNSFFFFDPPGSNRDNYMIMVFG